MAPLDGPVVDAAAPLQKRCRDDDDDDDDAGDGDCKPANKKANVHHADSDASTACTPRSTSSSPFELSGLDGEFDELFKGWGRIDFGVDSFVDQMVNKVEATEDSSEAFLAIVDKASAAQEEKEKNRSPQRRKGLTRLSSRQLRRAFLICGIRWARSGQRRSRKISSLLETTRPCRQPRKEKSEKDGLWRNIHTSPCAKRIQQHGDKLTNDAVITSHSVA